MKEIQTLSAKCSRHALSLSRKVLNRSWILVLVVTLYPTGDAAKGKPVNCASHSFASRSVLNPTSAAAQPLAAESSSSVSGIQAVSKNAASVEPINCFDQCERTYSICLTTATGDPAARTICGNEYDACYDNCLIHP